MLLLQKNKMGNDTATICAIATPPGSGAIAVIRLSGEQAIDMCDNVYSSPKSNKTLIDQPPNTIHYGSITDAGEIVDEVLISLFKAPHSFTGENTAEISCHGSPYIQQRLLEVFTKHGARMAEPGEFTMRAFMNGKMDLSQAEGVADLVAADSAASKRLAFQQMRGGFSKEIARLREQLLEFISLVELELDFSEEDVEFADRRQLHALIEKIMKLIKKLLDSFNLGNVLKNGVPVVIAGAPNSGKSTLLNTLVNEERAIVSEIAGTTRDTIEDTITLNGINFRFIDTAGLRETKDKIESLGIERTHSKIQESEIVILILDAQASLDDIQHQITGITEKFGKQNLIPVINKIDLLEDTDTTFAQTLEQKTETKVIPVSAKNETHLDTLKDELVNAANIDSYQQSDIIVSNMRHKEALQNTYDALNRAYEGIDSGIPGDLLSQDVREALHYLGEITGEVTTDEVLGNIFENFCIGK